MAKPVEAFIHDNKRTNLPTADAHDFVPPDMEAPKMLLYPRDPSLDPQLVWKGKDKLDQADLEVEAPPIYIQEKIDPRVLVENLRETAEAGELEPELTLFETFDGLDDLSLVEFYEHEANWANRMILGDSLQVMASLAERESLRGKVQMIYVDPPYGIEFRSNWQATTSSREVKDGEFEDASREVEIIRAFRDTWELGIHSYLSYFRDRLLIAHDLLCPTGSIFIQIGDDSVHLLRSILDEIFGSDCYVTTICVKKKGNQRSSYMDPVNDYLLWYSRTSRHNIDGGPKYRRLYSTRDLDEDTLRDFPRVELVDGSEHPVRSVPDPVSGEPRDYRLDPSRLLYDHPGCRLYSSNPLTSGGTRTNQSLPFTWEAHTFDPGEGNSWKHTARSDEGPSGMERLGLSGRLIAGNSTWRFKRYFDDFPYKSLSNWWDGLGGAGNPIYVVQTNSEIVKRCMLMTTDPGDLILDPTCGSGTTAVVAEQWGRRWITIDTSRVALALARGRLMGEQYPYYLLVDSDEGRAKLESMTGRVRSTSGGGVSVGFVCKQIAHITSSSIANNPDILPGLSSEQIHKAITRHSEIEDIIHEPFKSSKVVRVSGPFTVESLSPHRSLAFAAADQPASESPTSLGADSVSLEQTILTNLATAGIQNGRRNERLEFDLLEPYAGSYVQAVGSRENADEGIPARVGISIGPEYGTVGPQFIKNAAREAIKAGDIDLLCVLGFSFDPSALGSLTGDIVSSDEGFDVAAERKLGRVPVLLVRMNADLVMGEELKKTGSGNLFTVFGEPDIAIRESHGELTVEIRGVDVYDPTTGEIRSNGTDQIALWMIDSNYNGESFFVRHCYFTGSNDPYRRLRTALNADIDEEAWESLRTTSSRLFPRPETGRIAVKVINNYGDEVLKVFDA